MTKRGGEGRGGCQHSVSNVETGQFLAESNYQTSTVVRIVGKRLSLFHVEECKLQEKIAS